MNANELCKTVQQMKSLLNMMYDIDEMVEKNNMEIVKEHDPIYFDLHEENGVKKYELKFEGDEKIIYVVAVSDSPHKTVQYHYKLYTEDENRQKRSEEHTSELQSRFDLVCRLLLEKK